MRQGSDLGVLSRLPSFDLRAAGTEDVPGDTVMTLLPEDRGACV